MNKKILSILFITILICSIKSISLQNTIKQQTGNILINSIEQNTDQCQTPQIYQYIKNFSLPVSDVKNLLLNQLSHNNLSDIKVDKVVLYNIVYQSSLLSNDQSVSFVSPIKATVINENSRFTFNYKINITEGFPAKVHQYNGTTIVDKIKFTYTKEFNPQTGSSAISGVSVSFLPSMMKTTYGGNPNSTQTKKFQPLITGNSSSIYASFNTLITTQNIVNFLSSNCKKQSLSAIYQTNPYKYQYYEYNTNIDVSTLSANLSTVDGTSILLNGINGKFSTASKQCSNYTPELNNSSPLMFISAQFIQNFIQNTMTNYKNWSNIQVDKSWSRSQLLQFRLLDLEYIVDGLFDGELSSYYQNEVVFRCKIFKNVGGYLDYSIDALMQTIDWQCQANVLNVNGKQVKIMDFQPRIQYIVKFNVGQSLSVYLNTLTYIDCNFNTVDNKYSVSDKVVAQKYIQTTFNDFRRYVPGTYFKINPNSKSISISPQREGIFIL